MDNILILILMIALYLVPELIKRRRRPSEYKYPEIPDKPLPQEVAIQQDEKIKQHLDAAYEEMFIPDNILPSAPKKIEYQPVIANTVTAAKPQLSKAAIINGIILSEVLQPPQAYKNNRRFNWKKK